jgi:thiol reductant ABC exporter CydC subunit
VDALQDLYLRTLLPIVIAVGAAVIGTVAVGAILPWAALTLGASLAVALVLPAALTWRRSGDDEMAALSGALSAQVVDALEGAPELLAFGADEAALSAVEEVGRRADALEQRHAHLATASALVIQLCLAVAVVATLAIGVVAVHSHHLGQVMIAVLPLAVIGTFETIPGVPIAVARALTVRASADRLFALEDVPVPVVDPTTPEPVPPGVPTISFEDASLRYDPGLPRALNDVSLRLPAGGRLAVTGSSGAGKSSLVTALLRYWPLESGTLTVGGIDVTRLGQHDVRAVTALADQRAQLFAGTLRSNLTLARPDASDDDIDRVLAAAQLRDWVATLPDGLDTQVGEGGVALSGGERRRLAVARALLAPGSVLLLDEPTSGLDPEMGDRLLAGVFEEAGERSVLLVTHRAAEAQRCDTTVALEVGRVVASPELPGGA